MRVIVYSAKGIKTEKKMELPEDIFGVKPNATVLRQYIHVYRNIQRAGTVATKTRGEVSGGGRKPWVEKGTGRARHGPGRHPVWDGGALNVVPRPPILVAQQSKKVKDLAL